jgi:hypothetical protein
MINDLYHIYENGLYKNLNSFKNLAKASSRVPAAHIVLAVTA